MAKDQELLLLNLESDGRMASLSPDHFTCFLLLDVTINGALFACQLQATLI
jgi:hypothetical protein